ncbi:MAG: hypothetical protein Q8N96_02835 [Methylovulum sp.]|nr:hypothetical protein [Methylovulum sp.]
MNYTTLISAETLQQNLNNPDWIIVDTRSQAGALIVIHKSGQ